MKSIITVVIGSLAAMVAILVPAADGVGSESGYYSFSSGYLDAAYKSGFVPVLSQDKKGAYIETGKGIKRIRFGAECRLIPKLGISDQIVTITDIKYGFDNLRQSPNGPAMANQHSVPASLAKAAFWHTHLTPPPIGDATLSSGNTTRGSGQMPAIGSRMNQFKRLTTRWTVRHAAVRGCGR